MTSSSPRGKQGGAAAPNCSLSHGRMHVDASVGVGQIDVARLGCPYFLSRSCVASNQSTLAPAIVVAARGVDDCRCTSRWDLVHLCAGRGVVATRRRASMGSPPTIFRLTRRRRGSEHDSRAVCGAPVEPREGAAPSSAPKDAPKKTMCARNPVFSGNKKG